MAVPVYVDGENVLRSGNLTEGEDVVGENLYSVFGNAAFHRDEIRSITFMDRLNGFGKDSSTWNVSADGSDSVKAMALPASDGGYNLYIGAEGGVALPEDCTALFMNYTSLTEINFNGCVDFSRVTSMRYMFYNCINLEELALVDVDTSNVRDMTGMFYECINIRPDLSGLDTSNVTNMSYMFANCIYTGELYLSSFNTSNVTDMSYMFCNCTLSELDIESFDTSKVQNMSHMFASTTAVRSNYIDYMDASNSGYSLDLGGELNLWNFDYSSVTDASNMFKDQSRIGAINLGSFNASKLENMSGMFKGCEMLRDIYWHDVDTTSVTDMSSLFENCYSLKPVSKNGIDYSVRERINQLKTGSVQSFKNMFKGCTSLYDLFLAFDTSSATSMRGMFNGCTNLKSLQLGFDSSNVTDFAYMFADCHSLEEIRAGALDTSSATDVSHMFDCCYSIAELDLSSYDLSNVRNMEAMFANCGVLQSIKATPLFASTQPYSGEYVTGDMFKYCPAKLYISACSDLWKKEDARIVYAGEDEWTQLAFGRNETSQGEKGESVVWLQTALNAKGYSVGDVDGHFGQKTENALRAFQQDAGLEVTGKADYASQKALYQ